MFGANRVHKVNEDMSEGLHTCMRRSHFKKLNMSKLGTSAQ